jgi:hypothetical protein
MRRTCRSVPVLAWLRRRRHVKDVAVDRHHRIGRNNEGMVRGDRHAVLRLHHRHRGVLGQQFDQQALVMGVEVLNQDEGHAVLWWHVRKKALKGLEPTCGRAKPYNQPYHVRVVSRSVRGARTGRCSFSPLRRMPIRAAIPVLPPSRHELTSVWRTTRTALSNVPLSNKIMRCLSLEVDKEPISFIDLAPATRPAISASRTQPWIACAAATPSRSLVLEEIGDLIFAVTWAIS